MKKYILLKYLLIFVIILEFIFSGFNSMNTYQSQAKTNYFSKYKKYLLAEKEYKKLQCYKYIAMKLKDDKIKIKNSPYNFKKSVENFKNKYQKYKNTYNEIAKKVTKKVFSKKERTQYGIPSEIIAALHYRENESDFLSGKFEYSPEDGEEKLSKKTKKERIKKFISIEVDMFKSKKTQIKNIHLRYESEDIVAMCVVALLHNGVFDVQRQTGNPKDTWKHSAYVFSGTNEYTSGKWQDLFENGTVRHIYNSNLVDKQVGVLRTLDAILEVK